MKVRPPEQQFEAHHVPDLKSPADYIGSHWVGREDMRKQERGSLRKGRLGNVMLPVKPGEFSFYRTHKRWTHKFFSAEGLPTNLGAWFDNVTGYEQTDMYVKHGHPKDWYDGWHTMYADNCTTWL